MSPADGAGGAPEHPDGTGAAGPGTGPGPGPGPGGGGGAGEGRATRGPADSATGRSTGGGAGTDTGTDGPGADTDTGARATRRARKQVLLRLDPLIHEALARWAGEELRSTNAQIEFLLRRVLAEAGRLPRGARPIPRRGRPRLSEQDPGPGPTPDQPEA